MNNRKFDFVCIYYANELIFKLHEAQFFSSNMVLAEKLRYILLTLVQNNYMSLGKVSLTEEQMTKAIKRATKEFINHKIDDMAKDGLVAYAGIDGNGEYFVELTEAGRQVDG